MMTHDVSITENYKTVAILFENSVRKKELSRTYIV